MFFHIEAAKQTIRNILLSKTPCIVPLSGGKDSHTVLGLTIDVARDIVTEFGTDAIAPINVVNADPVIDIPEVKNLLDRDVYRLKKYCKEHRIQMFFHQTTPALLSEYVVQVFSGRNLPVFANSKNRQCSVDLKCVPMEKLKKTLTKALFNTYKKQPITLLGTRFEESTDRKERMLARGESAEAVWENNKQSQMLSPIADWSTGQVWHYLRSVTNGEERGFTTYSDLEQLYIDGTDKDEFEQTKQASCRFGCSLCCVGEDRSMINLLKNNPSKYGYMAGIHKLQKYLLATMYDFEKRVWIGRTIRDGYVAVQPDTYSPQMLEDLFLMALTIDIREQEEADRLGIAPRFQLLHPRAIIAIDALWCQQGVHETHHALFLYKKVYHDGFRMDVPEIAPVPRQKVPEKRWLFVGDDWNDGDNTFSGLRSLELEMICASDSFAPCGKTDELSDGRKIMSVNYSPTGLFDVDMEGAYFVLDFELDYMLKKHGNDRYAPSSGFNDYAILGTIELSNKRHAGMIDDILKRTSFRNKIEMLGFNYDRETILAMSISDTERMQEIKARETQETIMETIKPAVASISENVWPDAVYQKQGQLDIFDFLGAA